MCMRERERERRGEEGGMGGQGGRGRKEKGEEGKALTCLSRGKRKRDFRELNGCSPLRLSD